MIKVYDYLDGFLEDKHRRMESAAGEMFLVSELMDQLGYKDEADLQRSLMRAFEICCTLQIPISANFKKLYRYDDVNVREDWQVSGLGCYLLLINGNSCNPNVARAQFRAIISAYKK